MYYDMCIYIYIYIYVGGLSGGGVEGGAVEGGYIVLKIINRYIYIY